MNIVLCDDELIYLDTISHQILTWAENNKIKEKVFIKEYSSSEDLLEAWDNGMSIDAVFLDIQIPGEISGMDLAKAIYDHDEYIPIVFITNYEEYACDGYCVNAIRYLRKPVSLRDISVCMDIIWRRWQSGQERFVTLTTGTQSVHIAIRTIVYAEVTSHMIHIFTSDDIGQYTIRSTMDDLESKLPDEDFIRCHKSYLVNLRYIRKYRNNWLTLASGKQIPVGRKYTSQFVCKLQKYYQEGDKNVGHN